MEFVLTLCAALFSVSGHIGIENARSFSEHVWIGAPSDRMAATRRYSSSLDGDTEGFGSHQTIPRPLPISERYPLEALIILAVFVVCGIAIVLYIGQLVIIGWVVDFLSEIGVPKIQALPGDLEYEQVGEIIVVTLRDNIATIGLCLAVQKQLKRLIDAQHCDFVLDFSCADSISMSFREVMVRFLKAARAGSAEVWQTISAPCLAARAGIPSI